METSLAPGVFNPQQATRLLNTPFQISNSLFALVTYSVQITVTASISGGQNGDIILETADDAAFMVNVRELAIQGTGQTYSLAIALQGVQPQTVPVIGCIEPGKWCRIRTQNNLGTPAYAYRSGLEILFSG